VMGRWGDGGDKGDKGDEEVNFPIPHSPDLITNLQCY
jgi:hypothetical protein